MLHAFTEFWASHMCAERVNPPSLASQAHGPSQRTQGIAKADKASLQQSVPAFIPEWHCNASTKLAFGAYWCNIHATAFFCVNKP